MSLNLKMSMVILLALAVTLGMYILADWVESAVAEKNYKSTAAVEKNVGAAYESLQKYIGENNIKGTDSDALQNWIEKHDYTYLSVYDNDKSTFDGGWQPGADKDTTRNPVTPGEQRQKIEKKRATEDYSGNEQQKIDPDIFKSDVRNRIVEFADGPYYVYIDTYKQQYWYDIMIFVKVILCAITFIGIMLLYNGTVLRRIINLSNQVEKISDGDLHAGIVSAHNDEIGKLAVSVDTMRDSILEKLQNEKAAWDANTQLITAMSHDIRTPLTSLIGYLDIIEGGKFSSEDEMKRYIGSCRDKAFQLKDLSDKLFQYFLVFGSQTMEKYMEVFDGGILINQLISEHAAELISYGFKIDFDYFVPETEIRVDISSIRRLFDNMFSNIMKYGDKNYHVSIRVDKEDDWISVRVINRILESSRKVESNKIGLKTCEKICLDMGGLFVYKDDEKMFSARVSLPVYKGVGEGEKDEKGHEN